MEINKEDLKKDIKTGTEILGRRLESYWKIIQDPERKKRIRERLCQYHYYGTFLAGQAFTDWVCRACGKEGRHHNTGTPEYCDECAKKYKICKDCGAKLNTEFLILGVSK